MSFEFTMVPHEVGKLSRSGVLDIGLKCPHSCEFCYYSYLDGSEDQFKGMRHGAFRPLEDCKRALDFMAAQGLERLDITGGEPLFHPDIVEIVRYAEKEKNLRVRMITLAQLFERIDPSTGKILMNALLDDAQITEFLLSTHAVDRELYRSITRGQFARLERAMDELDERGFEYCTNTVVYANNAAHVPQIARYIVEKRRRVRISNFIAMNAYHAWATGKAFGVQASYAELAGPLREAVEILEAAGIGVNVRYVPYCMAKGLERNIVGVRGVMFDPYEWRNNTRNPFGLIARTGKEAVEWGRRALASNNKVFVGKCRSCSLREICDGVDANYLARYGEGEVRPYAGELIKDLVHFRRANRAVFEQKQKRNAGGLMLPNGRRHAGGGAADEWGGLVAPSLRKFYWSKLYRRVFPAELPTREAKGQVGKWAEGWGPYGQRGRVVPLGPGGEICFSFVAAARVFLLLGVRVAASGGARDGEPFAAPLRLHVRVQEHGGAEIGIDLAVGSKWKVTRLRLRNRDTSAVKVMLARPATAAADDVQVLCFEPVVARRVPLGYVTKLVCRSLWVLGPLECYRRLFTYANYYSSRDIEADGIIQFDSSLQKAANLQRQSGSL